jgi:tetratricopeptide (TPR) repeat protein
MDVSPRRRLFHRPNQNNIYRAFLWTLLIVAGIWVVYGVKVTHNIKEFGQPTLTPTRASVSYVGEGEAHFIAGDIPRAIIAYQHATEIDPNNAEVWAKLARIQTYSSQLKTTDVERQAALNDALRSADQAKALAPEDSTVAAIRAFVLDWKASQTVSKDESARLLTEADQEASRAYQLDNANTLALVFYAEIQIDQQKWSQGEEYLNLAKTTGSNLMDWHRVYAYFLETQGAYSKAIEEYDRAIALAPNMTFLYLYAGANYRQLAFLSPIKAQQTQLYERANEYFARAVAINSRLEIKDPIPYLSIAKTYSQTGDYFAAALNVQRALDFKPDDPDIYGQLGVVFRKSRNFEGSIDAFKCAIEGCNPAESCLGRYGRECNPAYKEQGVEVKPLALSQYSIVYYYSYASNLAALSRPQDNKCPKARSVMAQIRAGGYDSDLIVSEILAENEAICQIVDRGGALAQLTPVGTPAGTPQPGSDTMSEFTPTPSPTPTP